MTQSTPVPDQVRRAAHEGDWAERLGRAGLVARGVLYAALGVVAFQVAWGDRSESADKGGALQLLAEQPFGDALLAVIVLGLASYAAWCLLEAVLEQPDGGSGADGTDEAKSWAKRIGYVGRAIGYGVACVTAIGILRHDPSSSGSETERSLTATVLAWGPAGQLLVGAIGAGFVTAGLWNAYRAVTTKFEEHLVVDSGPTARRAVTVSGVAGLLGRAVAFAAIGWFVLDAAIRVDPNQPLGLDESLAELAAGPVGPVGLSLVAIGLLLFGLFSLAEARWKDLGT
jgi:hypothetical protein